MLKYELCKRKPPPSIYNLIYGGTRKKPISSVPPEKTLHREEVVEVEEAEAMAAAVVAVKEIILHPLLLEDM